MELSDNLITESPSAAAPDVVDIENVFLPTVFVM